MLHTTNDAARGTHAKVDVESLLGGTPPSDLAIRLKDKVVLIAQDADEMVDMTHVARALRTLGHPPVVLNNAAFTTPDRRALPVETAGLFYRTEYIPIDRAP